MAAKPLYQGIYANIEFPPYVFNEFPKSMSKARFEPIIVKDYNGVFKESGKLKVEFDDISVADAAEETARRAEGWHSTRVQAEVALHGEAANALPAGKTAGKAAA